MDDSELLSLLANGAEALLYAAEYLLDDNIARKRKRSCWVSPWLLKRPKEGVAAKLLPELREGVQIERTLFTKFHCMSESDFEFLHALVAPIIRKMDTNMRPAIPTDVRLHLTLHFLVTGNSFLSLQYIFRLPQCRISTIIPETLDAIYNVLAPTYLKTPSSADEWKAVARKFETNWNFPNCVGALDGKHVVITALLGRSVAQPYVLVADDAFALRPNIMKPHGGRNLPAPKRIFNYRLSRARRTIENTFGIMSARFRVLRSAINLDALKTRKVVKATCALHNFLLERSGKSYAPNGFVDQCDDTDGTISDGNWRNEPPSSSLAGLQRAQGRDRTASANAVRDEFTEFFMTTPGEVPWQYQKI